MDYRKLTLDSIEDTFNVHWHADGYYVSLQHVTARVLVNLDQINMRETWSEYLMAGGLAHRHDLFEDWVRNLTDEPDDVDDWVEWCADCVTPYEEDDLYSTNDSHGQVCEGCFDDYYGCSRCDQTFRSTTTTLGDEEVCQSCRDNHFSWCDQCEGYYPDNQGCGGDHGGDDEDGETCGEDCESPQQMFAIRNDGLDPLRNDQRATVTLPAGMISDEGIGAIARMIRDHGNDFGTDPATGVWDYVIKDPVEREKWRVLSFNLAPLGSQWQAKDGNYTKRLSRHAYKNHGLKVPASLISSIGNTASDHSRAVDFEIEVTRDLNQSASSFAHSESCWWQSYYHGRCALKTSGGFGLRTFKNGSWPTGRAWVMPLLYTGKSTATPTDPNRCQDPSCCKPVPETSGGFVPTFRTEDADAFVVFNGYGDLSDYAPARILAHMAGMTYRKVNFRCSPMYVNGEMGYLVAPEEIAQHYTDGGFALAVEQHSVLFDTERTAAAADNTSEELVHA